MALSRFTPRSIVSKLILLNGIILIAFGSVILINFSLTRQTKNLVLSFMDKGMNQVLENDQLSRDLNNLSVDIQLFVTTFTLDRNRLKDDTSRLAVQADFITRSLKADAPFNEHIKQFSRAVHQLLSQCQQVSQSLDRIEETGKELDILINQVEAVVTEQMIAIKQERRGYVFNSLEQVETLIPDLRYLLLKIQLIRAESEQAHLKPQRPDVDYETLLRDMIQEVESSFSLMVVAGERLSPHGELAVQTTRRFSREISEFLARMRQLQIQIIHLYQKQDMVIAEIAIWEKKITKASENMREEMIKSLRSSAAIMGIMVLLVICVSIVAGFYAVRIARPIQQLTKSVSAIASGDLDRHIPTRGNDEVAILSESFLKMRNSIREKINDLAEKNQSLLQEISLRKKTETALRQNEKKYRTLLESIPQKIFYKDRNSVFISCNENFSRDVNLFPDDLVGKTDFDLFPAELAIKYTEDDQRIIKTGQTEAIEEPYLQGGNTFVVNTVKTPVKDEDGQIIGLLGIFWDITEKKRIEDELRKYELITTTSRDLMAIVGRDYKYQAVNKAYTEAFEKEKDWMVGRHFSEVVGEEIFSKYTEPRFLRCLKGEIVNFKTWYNYPALGQRYIDVAYTPFFDADGNVAGIVTNSRDMTTTKRLEKKLAQAQKMEAIGTLAGGIAHDFNNILGAIMGYTELLILDIPPESEAGEWLKQVSSATERAKQLVYQILAFSRQTELQSKPITLSPIIDEAVALIRASIPSSIAIEKKIKKTSGSVMADPTQIHQVLINLCTNAAHAMEEKGGCLTIILDEVQITESAKIKRLKPGAYFKVTVKDTGHGIDEEHLSRIFDPYFTTKEKGVGTGLGLATVHGIINGFGGGIEVDSRLGIGTVFEIYLPKIDEVGESLPEGWGQLPKTGKGRILLVDDEEALLKVGEQMLSRLGYEVETSSSPVSALELFQKDPSRCDLVITDQTMPGMSGQEMAGKMMKIRPGLRVVLCTGFSELIQKDQLSAIGISTYLKKPISLSDYSKAVQKALESQS